MAKSSGSPLASTGRRVGPLELTTTARIRPLSRSPSCAVTRDMPDNHVFESHSCRSGVPPSAMRTGTWARERIFPSMLTTAAFRNVVPMS